MFFNKKQSKCALEFVFLEDLIIDTLHWKFNKSTPFFSTFMLWESNLSNQNRRGYRSVTHKIIVNGHLKHYLPYYIVSTVYQKQNIDYYSLGFNDTWGSMKRWPSCADTKSWRPCVKQSARRQRRIRSFWKELRFVSHSPGTGCLHSQKHRKTDVSSFTLDRHTYTDWVVVCDRDIHC